MKCDVCGFEITDEENAIKTIMAVEVDYEDSDHPTAKRVLEVFGKAKFAVCLVCWLKSLGVKELKIEQTAKDGNVVRGQTAYSTKMVFEPDLQFYD